MRAVAAIVVGLSIVGVIAGVLRGARAAPSSKAAPAAAPSSKAAPAAAPSSKAAPAAAPSSPRATTTPATTSTTTASTTSTTTASTAPSRTTPASPTAIQLTVARTLLPDQNDCSDIPCLIARSYRSDAQARDLAVSLWNERGDLAGVGTDEIMDGGYRGQIHLVPQLPTGPYRKHLAWLVGATRTIDEFFTALFAPPSDPAPHPATRSTRPSPPAPPSPRYRWRDLAFRFVRSVGKRTPSAYASSWTVTYNVEGSLLISAAGVLDTLFHELFHLNDEDHGDWSARQLQTDYDAIVDRCAKLRPTARSVACLAPYAPNTTRVRGGTYYAFQPNNGNGVHEYAAELAVRYFREHSEMLARRKLSHPAFKCGPPENARAWRAFVDEFFAGRDLVPGC